MEKPLEGTKRIVLPLNVEWLSDVIVDDVGCCCWVLLSVLLHSLITRGSRLLAVASENDGACCNVTVFCGPADTDTGELFR